MVILETERLVLRRLVPGDLDALYALYRDPEIRRYFPEGTLSYEETKEELEWFLNGHPRHPELGLWATIYKPTGAFIGRCGLLPWTIEERPEVEVAYLIDKAYWGQGLATEAAQAIVDYAFERLDLSRLVCMIEPGNAASARVAAKIGMTLEREMTDDKGPFLLYSRKKSMALTIRTATAEDYDRLCALWAELDALHGERLPQLFQTAGGPARERDYFAGLLADENVAVFVAEGGDALAGFVHVLVREPAPLPIFVPRRYAVVDNLAVTTAFRRQGVGRLLMDSAQRWAAARGAGAIELNVYAFNESAIAFYRSLGYEIYSVRMSRALAAPTTGRQPDAEKAHS